MTTRTLRRALFLIGAVVSAIQVPHVAHADFIKPMATLCRIKVQPVPEGRFIEFFCPFRFIYGNSKTSAVYTCEGSFRLLKTETKPPMTPQFLGSCKTVFPMFAKPGTYATSAEFSNSLYNPLPTDDGIQMAAAAVDENNKVAKACILYTSGFFGYKDPLCVDMPLP